MDATDVRLLRAMFPRPDGAGDGSVDSLRPAQLARSLGLSLNTVKSRVAQLEEEGVIAGYQIVPNLPSLGMSSAAYFLRATPAGKREARRGLERAGGLLTVHDYLGEGLCVDVAWRDEPDHDAKLAVLEKAADGARPQKFLDLDSPRATREPTALDWRIIRALREDPLAAATDVAERTGVSARTVKRRTERLAAEGAYYATVTLDPSRAGGLLLAEILFKLAPGDVRRARAAILREFDAERISVYEPASIELGTFDMLAFVRTPAEVERLRERAEGIAGVAGAEALLFSRFEDTSAWIDALIDERIEQE